MVIARADDPDLEAGSLTKRFPQPPCTSSSRPLDTSDSVIKRRSGPFRIDGDYAVCTMQLRCLPRAARGDQPLWEDCESLL
jgi:hypothetical protein